MPWACAGLTGASPGCRVHNWPWCKSTDGHRQQISGPGLWGRSWPLQVCLWFPCAGKTPRGQPAGSTAPGCASMGLACTFVLLPGCPGRTGVAPVKPQSTVSSSFKSLLKGHLCHDSCRKTDSGEAAPAPRPLLLH